MKSGAETFAIRHSLDGDGCLRLTLLGELDLAAAPRLLTCPQLLGLLDSRIVLDLSELRFIDAAGLRSLLVVQGRASRADRQLEVDRCVSPVIARLAKLADVEEQLWPAAGADRS